MTNSKTHSCMLSIWFYLRNTRRRTAEWESMVRVSLLTTSSPLTLSGQMERRSTTTRLLHIKVDHLAISQKMFVTVSHHRKCNSHLIISAPVWRAARPTFLAGDPEGD